MNTWAQIHCHSPGSPVPLGRTADPTSPDSLRYGILDWLCRTYGLGRDFHLRLSLLAGIQRVDLAKPIQIGQRRLHIRLDQVARIELDINKVRPWEGVVLVRDIGHAGVHFLRDVSHDWEGDLQLLLLGSHSNALQRALAIEQRHRGMHLWDEVEHGCRARTVSRGMKAARRSPWEARAKGLE